MSLRRDLIHQSTIARALLLIAAAAIGGCGGGNALTDCAARCQREPHVRDYHGCYKACHMSYSSCR